MDWLLRPSRSGPPTCAADGLWLHSLYDPEREALRFAASELASSKPSRIVLLGPCLDYLSIAARSLLPGTRVVSVQYSAFFADHGVGRADADWYPGSNSSLDSFLDSVLDEDSISGVAVLEWEPAARAFPAEALAARAAVRSSLDRLASSAATVKSSGRRWIANACASFLLVERALRPEGAATGRPILVATAGPSLRRSLLAVGEQKGRFATIAVSSSLAACRAAGIEPDIVVATDGGYWSRLHLYPLADRALPLASPLTAQPSASLYRSASLLILDQGSFPESQLLPLLCPALAMPPHGTVSGTAIMLAARLGAGPIIVAGLDLASQGVLDHARPHGFDALRDRASARELPLEGEAFARSLESAPILLAERPWRSSRSLSAYASALAMDSKPLAGRLYRLSASPVALQGFEPIDASAIRSLASTGSTRARGIELADVPIPSRAEREIKLRRILSSWRDIAASASEGLGRGIPPSEPLVSELLRSIDIVDYAAARRAILSGGEPAIAARDLAASCDLFLTALSRRFAP